MLQEKEVKEEEGEEEFSPHPKIILLIPTQPL
jgi:hypothetical protein